MKCTLVSKNIARVLVASAGLTLGAYLVALPGVVKTEAVGPLPAAEPMISGGAEAAQLPEPEILFHSISSFGTASGDAPPGVGAPVIAKTFDGFDYIDNITEGNPPRIPPDAIGAAGFDRVIAVVNSMIEVRDKEAGMLLARDSLSDFFAPLSPVGPGFDPKIVWDHFEDRFVVVALDLVRVGFNPSAGNQSRILLAVSKVANPGLSMADWYFHAIDAKTTIGGMEYFADYPGFEVDEEVVYVTANLFCIAPCTGFGGVRLWIVDKGVVGGFYDGGYPWVTDHDPYASGGIATTSMPAQVFGASGVGPGIGTFLVSYSGFSEKGVEAVQVVRVDNPLGAVAFTHEFVDVGDIDDTSIELFDAPQSGTDRRIEVNDRRALDAVSRDGELWMTTTILPNSGPDVGETTAHWFRLDTSRVVDDASRANLIALGDQGDIGGEDIAPATTTFFPSVAVNAAGDAMFGFAASAPSIFAGAFVAGRRIGDPPGEVRPSETIRAGLDVYIRDFSLNPSARNRWGDYTGISNDPVDDDAFWIFNQYAIEGGLPEADGDDGLWGTAWAHCDREVMDVDVLVDVDVNVRKKRINSRSGGPVTVAILGSEKLDVTLIDVETLEFGPGSASPTRNRVKDFDRDGFDDLLSDYSIAESGLVSTVSEACVDGEAFRSCDGVQFQGCDEVDVH